jgi:hypothetical protein
VERGGQDRLGLVDATATAQPFRVVELELSAFEGPALPVAVRQRLVELGLLARRIRKDGPGPAEQLCYPRGETTMEPGVYPIEDFASVRLALGADARGRQVSDTEIGHVVVQGSAVIGEQMPELAIGREVVAGAQGGNALRMPGPGGQQAVVFGVDRRSRITLGWHAAPASVAFAAQGLDGGRDQGSRRPDGVRLEGVRLGRERQRVVPAPGVDVHPSERAERSAARALRSVARSPAGGRTDSLARASADLCP